MNTFSAALASSPSSFLATCIFPYLALLFFGSTFDILQSNVKIAISRLVSWKSLNLKVACLSRSRNESRQDIRRE